VTQLRMIFILLGLLTISISSGTTTHAASTFLGPTPYLSFSDSPFSGLSFDYFYLEDFEDNLLNTPGVTVNSGFPAGYDVYGQFIDSVDGDDGAIDGFGFNAHSYVTWSVNTLIFSFDSGTLGTLPSHVGIVWTDSTGLGDVSFEAFDAANVSLGMIGPVTLGNGSTVSQTAEDRFFGIINESGISQIVVNNAASQNWEVDHLQYGAQVPIPSSFILLVSGIALGVWCKRRSISELMI
jgi:hypothetical protein